MSYTTPSTKATGDLLAASDWNTYVRDNFTDHEARIGAQALSGCLLTRTTNQAIANTAFANLTFTTETYDAGGWFDTGTSSTTVTVPAGAIPAGYTTIAVQVSIAFQWAGDATGKRAVRFLKNGTEFAGNTVASPDANQMAVTCTAPPQSAVAGDLFTVEVAQTSGGSLNVIGATQPTVFAVTRVGYFA